MKPMPPAKPAMNNALMTSSEPLPVNAATVPIASPEAGMKLSQNEDVNPRSISTLSVFIPFCAMVMRQPSALRGIVSFAGVVPFADILLLHLIDASAPDGFESTVMTSCVPFVIVAHDERTQAARSSDSARFTISPASPLRSL
jgi:hypothetical protein